MKRDSGNACSKGTVTTSDEFADRMLLLARPAEQFRPSATYDPDGDCIEFLAKPDPFYAERLDDLVTVYYSQTTKEVIGSLIKGVKSFHEHVLAKMPGFSIEIDDGKIKLVHIFRAQLWSTRVGSQEMLALTYKKLINVANEVEVEAEKCFA
jgi:hypothetical protein